MKITRNLPKTNESAYDDAREHIKCAIDILGSIYLNDTSDIVAKDSIVNLGVVLLDMQKD